MTSLRIRWIAAAAMAVGIVAALSASGQSSAAVSTALESVHHQFEIGDYSGAIAALNSFLAQNPNDAEAHYWLARCYYERREIDPAVSQFERSVQLNPQSSPYHQWLGRAYGEKADREHSFFLARRVKKEFQEAVRLDPSNINARRDLEQYCLEAPWIVGGSKDEARAQVDAITQLDPVEGHLARADFYLGALKKSDLADNEYHLALDAKPSRIEPYFEAVEFYMKQNKPAEMESAIEAAAKINSADPRLEYFRGVQRLLSSRDLTGAEQYLKSYLANSPERSEWPSHASAREWLGRLYELEGKRAEASEQYRAALQLDPGRKEARARLERLEKAAH